MAVVDLGTRCLLSLRGPDAVRYLNGQVTQDVRLLLAHPHTALSSCVTDAKGRLQAFVTLTLLDAAQPELWIEAPIELRDSLFARLSRYLIADDAEIEDLTSQYRLEHHIGSHAKSGDFLHHRFGVPGFDRWLSSDTVIAETELLTAPQVDHLRIQHGIAVWGRELIEGLLPPEAGLDATAISYQKGCYIGQEVISRMKSAGKVNRRLFCFTLDSESTPTGATLLDESGADAGVLTSVSHPYAIGYVTKKAFGQSQFSLRLPDGSIQERAAHLRDQR